MVPNGAAYANYPFANNGTKTPPGGSTESAKYALGMVPADTFPAEWANYFFHGATAGITRLNSDTGSIKKEINTVLENFNITPDATLNNQLLAALNKLKADAALAAHPVGSLYWTSVNENPAVTFGGGTWTQIKDKFILAAGDTYTNGATGGAATVTLTTDQIPSHDHSFTPSGTVSSHSHKVGAHSHGLNSHTHTIPKHKHGTGTLAASSQSLSASFQIRQGRYESIQPVTNCSVTTVGNPVGVYQIENYNLSKQQVTFSLSHGHSITGSTADSSELTSGTATGSTANSTAFDSGSTTPTFTGTAGTTDAKGGGGSHENMPPYIVKYCWERVS